MEVKAQVDILMPVGEKGGVERVTGKIAVYLKQMGFRIRVVQLVWERKQWVPDTVEFYPLFEGRGNYTLDQFVQRYTEFMEKAGKPDIILATAYPIMTLVARLAVTKLGRGTCKIVSWLHGSLEQYVAAGFGGIECLNKADSIFVLNEKTKKIIKEYNENCQVTVVKNPVDFIKCGVKGKNGWARKTLVYIGRLSAEKRIDVILRAVSMAREAWQLRLIGNGDEWDKLNKTVYDLHIERQVKFLGWKERPWEYVDGATALVLASEYEGFPMAAIESLARGIPVISTPVDGITEIIKPGVNGLLYPFGDSEGLAKILDLGALGKLPDMDEETCRDSVADYEAENALAEFGERLESVMDEISVIIPCYNVEKQIARCLDSVLNQTLHGVRKEIICIDDKSTDNTLQILQQYEKKYPADILLVSLENNGKQGNARNIGMLYASGDYVTFVDADDAIADQMLQDLYDEAVFSHCDVAECAYKEIWEGDSYIVTDDGRREEFDMRDLSMKKKYILKYGWKTAPWGRLYRKDFLMENRIEFPTDTYMEDIYFSERCMLQMERYVRIPKTNYFYCVNADGVMCSANVVNYYMDTVRVQNQIAQEAMERGMLDGCEAEYEYLHFSKAFAEPVGRMCRDERCFSYGNFVYLKAVLLHLFPNIAENTYLVNDKSKEMEIYMLLLKRDWNEKELYNLMWQKKDK